MIAFDEQGRLMRPKSRHAQILLELDGDLKTLETALGVLRSAGAEPFRCAHVGKGVSPRILIELSSRDMREAVRRLSEAGFVKVMGVNASQERSETKE